MEIPTSSGTKEAIPIPGICIPILIDPLIGTGYGHRLSPGIPSGVCQCLREIEVHVLLVEAIGINKSQRIVEAVAIEV